MRRIVRISLCFCFFILCLSAAVSAQVPPGYNPNLNIPIPTPFVPNVNIPNIPVIPDVKVPTPVIPDVKIPVPGVPNIKIPEQIPVTIPTHSIPTPVPLDPVSVDPFLAKPVQGIDYRDFTNVTVIGPTPAPRRGKEGYDEGMAFFGEEKYYSAWKAFTESQYEDWKEWADKCPQNKPATGEVWHDPAQWLQDMELKIRVDQSSTDMFFRVYKEDDPISDIYIAGSDEVSVMLPGNADYTIKDGIGRTWYGEKEAFGEDGTYETMTFDEYGSERIYLKSGYVYTLSINVTDTGGSDVDKRPESWEDFTR